MQSQSSLAAAQYQHTQSLSSPLSASRNRSSPLSTLQNIPRDTSASPFSIPDTTRSPSSISTSTPQSPLTPSNSSPRSFPVALLDVFLIPHPTVSNSFHFSPPLNSSTESQGCPGVLGTPITILGPANALPPNSPFRNPISTDGIAPKDPAHSPPSAISRAGQPLFNPVSASPSSITTLNTFRTSPSLAVDQAQLQSPPPLFMGRNLRFPPMPSAPRCTEYCQPLQTHAPGTTDFRTPNVYINGLPPNFPEEELFKMTASSGPCGYGFVLFETIDAAGKCIEALRKYRNLHPSFSKQIHKIPGTVYSTPTFQAAAGVQDIPADSFKARMEQLKDNASTNLYMEGLPLSIDEMTLAALVKPHKICSSRFFQTRLSNPPRMIAFVRFESRTAAEEIIERLHGRIIRGMEKSGARISVRFADTAEQRELRRMERTVHDDEHPLAHIMAQAALLNLKGGQVHPPLPQLSPLISPDIGRLPHGANISPLLVGGHLPPHIPHAGIPLAPLPVAPFRCPSSSSKRSFSSVCETVTRWTWIQEELLSLQDAQAQLQLKRGLGVGGARPAPATAAAIPRAQAQQGLAGRGQSKRRLLDVLQPCAIENDFHASALGMGTGQRQRNQTHASNARAADVPSSGLGQALHMRSTTMPSQYLSARALDGSGGLMSGGGRQIPAIGSTAGSNMLSAASKNAGNGAFARKPSVHNIQSLSASTLPRNVSSTTIQGHDTFGHAHGHGHEADEDGGLMVSPGLTFSPRTPATLSPATPFGGFFHAGESFATDGMGMGIGVGEKGVHMGDHHEHAKEAGRKAVGFKGVHV
ncbi:uncharacterized protein B0H18DRAFT_1120053 [Fomitopsis serialis]|uniref:uncharacterized protein n=1 Tax=Fomitopsis serialis TaxID=139415 RepID=UPI002007A2F4|nr:uncharacterized protein B0H18DRAFT_1120053 [Neoantrodia serialis]KAH9924198.1 hypothetical protein B0H18DRAFT_1120053 [Neoantrodia serialis]